MIYPLYGGEVQLEFDPDKHIYRVDGQIKPGVTGILEVIAKPALVGWAAKCCGLYLEQNLKPGIALDEIQIKELAASMKRHYRNVSTTAADIGSLVHAWVEAYIKHRLNLGEMPTMPFNPAARQSIGAFKDWESQHRVEYIASESKIYSRLYGFAGTMDIDAMIDDRRSILDLKTSTGIYPEMGLQLAAYQLAREEEGHGPYNTRWIIRIGKDGILEDKEFLNLAQDTTGFLAALNLHRWIKGLL